MRKLRVLLIDSKLVFDHFSSAVRCFHNHQRPRLRLCMGIFVYTHCNAYKNDKMHGSPRPFSIWSWICSSCASVVVRRFGSRWRQNRSRVARIVYNTLICVCVSSFKYIRSSIGSFGLADIPRGEGSCHGGVLFMRSSQVRLVRAC